MTVYSTDIVIVGGGIAGLWLLSQLKAQGYNAILLEANSLGCGQTILSQGIIHGGTKYAVKQQLSSIARHIKTMPARWHACLQGNGEVDLQNVEQLTTHQHLWIPEQLGGKFVGFLTSKVMQSRVKKLIKKDYPNIFQNDDFNGDVYSLNEPVLNVYSLLTTLRNQLLDSIFKIDMEKTQFIFGGHRLEKIISGNTEIKAQKFIFTAGAQNEMFSKKFNLEKIKTQRRPLRMLLLKSLPYPLYAHCVDNNFKPRLTITSYPTTEGWAWYIGGEVAEKGSQMESQATYEYGLQELKKLFPWLNLTELQWKAIYVDRAEPQQSDGKIPPAPLATSDHNLIFAWPVKLAYAPLLAQEILSQLTKENITPQNISTFLDLAKPEVTLPPWQDDSGWN